ncbi:hypothetical protein BDR03DRAFT_982231 [Suillus americanus]|nr:hypothetical protein BDR03DRAFT_982231 [Suillus americanus]
MGAFETDQPRALSYEAKASTVMCQPKASTAGILKLRFKIFSIVSRVFCNEDFPTFRNKMRITENRKVAVMILDEMTITDLHSTSRTCLLMAELGWEVLCQRLRCVMNPFLDHHMSTFLSTLHDANGFITGSVVQTMVKTSSSQIPRDLNVLVPYEGFDSLDSVIRRTLGFLPISNVTHLAIAPCINQFHKYTLNNKIITLSSSHQGQSILHIVLNAPTTADMVFMSTGGLCYFYPMWMDASTAVESHCGDLVLLDNQLGCVGALTSNFEVKDGMGFLGESCGTLCPTFWHHVEESNLHVCIDWNVDDSVTNVFHNADVEWRLNTECINDKCPYRVTVTYPNFEGPFLQVIKGIFYGVGCYRPFLVPVPVQDGVDRPATLDDIDVNFWVKQRELYDCSSTRCNLRRTFTRVPGFNITIEGKYTLYFEKPDPSLHQNKVLSRILSMTGNKEAIHGSVLVVKQMFDDQSYIVNMTKRDQLVANFLISTSVILIY